MSREQQLAQAFVEAADTLVDDFEIIEFLQSLAERYVQLLDVDAAGLLLADEHGKPQLAAASTEHAHLLELFELQTDTGPCVDCARTGVPIINADLQAEAARWPRFAEAAAATGFVAVHALPMRLRSTTIGAVNLFSAETRTLTAEDARTGQALADVATIGLLSQRGREDAERLTGQLQGALNSRVVIEQAKGILAERHKIGIDAAFEVLRRHARSNSLRLPQLAHDLVAGALAPAELLLGKEAPTNQ